MRNSQCTLLLSLLLWGVSFSNLLQNSNFSSELSNWEIKNNVVYLSNFSATSDGSGSLQLHSNFWGDQTSTFKQSVIVEKYADYVLYFNVYAGGHTEGYYGYQISDDMGKVLATSTPVYVSRPSEGQWVAVTVPFQSLEDGIVTIEILSYSVDWLAFDNIELKRVEHIYNATFSGGLTHWIGKGNCNFISNFGSSNDQSGCAQFYANSWGDTTSKISNSFAVLKDTEYSLKYDILPGGHLEGYYGYRIKDINGNDIIPLTSPIYVNKEQNNDWTETVINFNSGNHDYITIELLSYSMDWMAVDGLELSINYNTIKPASTYDSQNNTSSPFFPIGWYTFGPMHTNTLEKIKERGANTVHFADLGVDNWHVGLTHQALEWGSSEVNQVKFILGLSYPHVLSRVDPQKPETYNYEIYKGMNPKPYLHDDGSEYEYHEFLSTWITLFKNHSGVLAWQLGDEISCADMSVASIISNCAYLIKNELGDPNHQIYQVHAVDAYRDMDKFYKFTENNNGYSFDYYCNGLVSDPQVRYIGNHNRNMRLCSQNKWAGNFNVTQAVGTLCDGALYKFPTLKEYRWNVFSPITKGSRGLLNWIYTPEWYHERLYIDNISLVYDELIVNSTVSSADSWINYGNSSFNSSLSAIKDHSGSWVVNSTNWGDKASGIKQQISVETHTDYLFEYNVYAGGYTEGYYGYKISNTNGDIIKEVSPILVRRDDIKQWENVSVPFNSQDNSNLIVEMFSYSVDWVAFDNISVNEPTGLQDGDWHNSNTWNLDDMKIEGSVTATKDGSGSLFLNIDSDHYKLTSKASQIVTVVRNKDVTLSYNISGTGIEGGTFKTYVRSLNGEVIAEINQNEVNESEFEWWNKKELIFNTGDNDIVVVEFVPTSKLNIFTKFCDAIVTPTLSILGKFKYAMEAGWDIGYVTSCNKNVSHIMLYDQNENEYYLIVVNNSNKEVITDISISQLPSNFNRTIISDIESGEVISLTKLKNVYSFTLDSIEAYGVRLFKI